MTTRTSGIKLTIGIKALVFNTKYAHTKAQNKLITDFMHNHGMTFYVLIYQGFGAVRQNLINSG